MKICGQQKITNVIENNVEQSSVGTAFQWLHTTTKHKSVEYFEIN